MRFPRFQFVILLLAVAAVGAGQELPDGNGKDALKKLCVNCHELDTVTGSLRTSNGWRQTVEDMIDRGAEGSAADLDAVVEYLTKFFGKINVNTASVKELVESLGFAEKESQAIVAYRDQNGKFKDFEQLKKVAGVSAEKLQAKRSRIAFSL